MLSASFMDTLRPPGIVVVDIQGTIGSAVRPLEYARLLTRLREDNAVRGVVLNIDSPGGSATGSELIARATERLAAKKPVVAFIGGLGASGGYMLAAATRRIIALPGALVGSIGVIAYRPVVGEALSRLGVNMHTMKAGRLKDMHSPFREPTPEEDAKEQHILDALYALFVGGVARGRGLPDQQVRELATGEIFTATEAIGIGLVDQTGDIEDAIDWVVAETGLPRRVRVVRPRRTLRELVMGRGAFAGAELLLSDLLAPASGGAWALYTGIGRGSGQRNA